MPLNLEDGYAVNPVTGDSVSSVPAAGGNPLPTGKVLPLQGIMVDLEEVRHPSLYDAGEPAEVDAYNGSARIPGKLNRVPLQREKGILIPVEGSGLGMEMRNTAAPVVKTNSSPLRWGNSVPVRARYVTGSLPRRKFNALKNVMILDTEQGLNDPVVPWITQDQSGNLWFGTIGNGIYIYDGSRFRLLTEAEGLVSNGINDLVIGNDGHVWISTDKGLHMYDGDSLHLMTEAEGLARNAVESLMIDPEGRIWVTYHQESTVSRIDGNTIRTYTIDLSQDIFGFDTDEFRIYQSDFRIFDMEADKRGNIWFATWGLGAMRFDGSSFLYFREEAGFHANFMNSVTVDHGGRLWFGSPGGLSVLSGDSITYFTEKEGLSSSYVICSMADSNGHMWIGTSGGGVCKYTGDDFVHYTEREGLSTNYVNSLFEDNAGNIWVGTNGGGACVIQVKEILHLTDHEGLSNPVVFCMHEDSRGDIWFGTRGGGVSRYDGTSFHHYKKENTNLGNDYVLSIMEDRLGNFWFGTYGNGVSRFDGQTFTIFNNYQGISDYTINCMLEDGSGDLWFGTYRGGVTRFDGTNLFHYEWEQSGIDNFIHWITEDSRGNVWIAAWPGVKRIRNDSVIHITEREGLLDNTVMCILEDRHGNMWFGTERGISVLAGDRFIQITEKNGLCENLVKTLDEDSRGNVWAGTVNGLNRLSFSSAEGIVRKEDSVISHPLVVSYGRQDGLNGLNFYHDCLLDSRGRIWYGTGKNLTMIDPEKFEVRATPPSIGLNRIDIAGRLVDFRGGADSLSRRISYSSVADWQDYPLDLELPFRLNHLTFHFAGTDWIAPHKILYSYRIKNVDEDWSWPSPEAKADYRSLPSGTYTFEVSAIGEAQVWSEPFRYTFTVLPPWYLSWPAMVLYLAGMVVLIVVIVWWRTSALKQRQKKLEQRIEEATVEIKAQKDEVEAQRDEIEAQRDDLKKQRDLVMLQKKEITDSINYALRIQTAVLPGERHLDSLLPEHFVLFHPRDIVSGDFYWIKCIKNYLVVVVADCTGHGVPGAFMSILGVSLLNEQVGTRRLDRPGEILDRLRIKVKDTLAQEGRIQEQKDGMDMAMVMYDMDTRDLQYAGAFNPLYVFRRKDPEANGNLGEYASLSGNGFQLFELKGDRQPIAIHTNESSFTTREIKLVEGDTLYLFTDGYADQIGGAKGKKFLVRRFKKTLLDLQELPMAAQKEQLEQILAGWKGTYEQVDDILVLGVRV